MHASMMVPRCVRVQEENAPTCSGQVINWKK
jgi:hypothetical protein